jgi:hypothetical protein
MIRSPWMATASKMPHSICPRYRKSRAEGSVSASEDLLRNVKKAKRARLALEDGQPLALKCGVAETEYAGLRRCGD